MLIVFYWVIKANIHFLSIKLKLCKNIIYLYRNNYCFYSIKLYRFGMHDTANVKLPMTIDEHYLLNRSLNKLYLYQTIRDNLK